MLQITTGADQEQKNSQLQDCTDSVVPAVIGILGVFIGSYTGNAILAGVSGLGAWAAAYWLRPKCKVN